MAACTHSNVHRDVRAQLSGKSPDYTAHWAEFETAGLGFGGRRTRLARAQRTPCLSCAEVDLLFYYSLCHWHGGLFSQSQWACQRKALVIHSNDVNAPSLPTREEVESTLVIPYHNSRLLAGWRGGGGRAKQSFRSCPLFPFSCLHCSPRTASVCVHQLVAVKRFRAAHLLCKHVTEAVRAGGERLDRHRLFT